MMTKRANDLLEEVLRLPEDERNEVAARLIERLGPPDDEDVDPEWDAEILRRVRRIEDGTARTIPWEEARLIIRKHIDGPGKA